MYDIRVSPKLNQKFLDAYQKSRLINKELVKLNEDKAVSDEVGALIMIHTADGKFVEWGFRGAKQILGFIEHGYMPVRKFCPLVRKTCLGERCSFHIIRNGVGDCALVWSTIS